jgi:hypothetical protein
MGQIRDEDRRADYSTGHAPALPEEKANPCPVIARQSRAETEDNTSARLEYDSGMDAAIHSPPRSGGMLFLEMLAFGILCAAVIAAIRHLTN